MPKRNMDLPDMAPHQVDADQGAAGLADNRGQRRAGNAQRREPKPAENQDRIHNQIDDRS